MYTIHKCIVGPIEGCAINNSNLLWLMRDVLQMTTSKGEGDVKMQIFHIVFYEWPFNETVKFHTIMNCGLVKCVGRSRKLKTKLHLIYAPVEYYDITEMGT